MGEGDCLSSEAVCARAHRLRENRSERNVRTLLLSQVITKIKQCNDYLSPSSRVMASARKWFPQPYVYWKQSARAATPALICTHSLGALNTTSAVAA